MKKIPYIAMCLIITILGFKVLVLEKVSDLHGDTIDVMLGTLGRVVDRTNFLSELMDGEPNENPTTH